MRRRLQAWTCTNGHTTLQHDDVCVSCGASLSEFLITPEAVLELVTTVRVNPTGEAYQLGIAITRAGHARTFCRVEGAVRGLGHDRVVLERRGDMIIARGKRRSLRSGSRQRFFTVAAKVNFTRLFSRTRIRGRRRFSNGSRAGCASP